MQANKIEGIDSNPNWIKRSSVMEGLEDGSINDGKEEEKEDASEDTEGTTEDKGADGEEE